jgi:hypothetical protein
MGTRSLTFVYDNGTPVVCMYRQFDGYPEGHGAELAEFLSPMTVVNGIGVDTKNVSNGMGCLAAQMVAKFKVGAGGFYLYPTDTTDAWQEYEYHVYENRVKVTNPTEVIFEGSWQDFVSFCSAEEIS